MRERAFAVIGGSFGSVWTNDDLPSFPSSRLLYIYDNGGDRFDEVSRAKQRFSVGITLCCYAAKVLFSRSRYLHMFAYGLRIVPFICLIVKADTSLFRARARSL